MNFKLFINSDFVILKLFYPKKDLIFLKMKVKLKIIKKKVKDPPCYF